MTVFPTQRPATLARLDRLPPAVLIGFSLLIYGILAVWFSLLPNYATTPVLDIRSFAASLGKGLLYGMLLLALFAMYILLYRQARRGALVIDLGRILGVTVGFGLPLLLAYPINANDIFRYVIRGRISSVYGENPFLLAPDDLTNDLYVAFAGEWRGATSPYGPLWEGLAGLMTAISGDNLLLSLLLFKLLGLAAVVAAAVLLWLLADQAVLQQRPAAALLWAWNPAILLSFVANAHNDALMICLLLLGAWLIRRGRAGPGLMVAVAAVLVKPIAALAVPLLFIAAWRSGESARERAALLGWLVVGGGLLTWLSFLPYGGPGVLLPRLLEEAAGGAGFSPFALFYLFAVEVGWQPPLRSITMLLPILFLLYYAWLSWLTWHGRGPQGTIPRAFIAYLVQALNFRIWYATWPLPWLILDALSGRTAATRALEAGIWFLLTSQLSVLIYGHMRFDLLGGDLFLSHLTGIVFVFVIPLILPFVFTLTPSGHSQSSVKMSTPT